MPLAVHTTLDDARAAKTLARSAVEARLAACVHVETVTSVFRWDGVVREATEYRLLFKTSDAAYPALAEHILAAHPYEEPALWAIAIEKGAKGYLDWIAAETASD